MSDVGNAVGYEVAVMSDVAIAVGMSIEISEVATSVGMSTEISDVATGVGMSIEISDVATSVGTSIAEISEVATAVRNPVKSKLTGASVVRFSSDDTGVGSTLSVTVNVLVP